MAEPSPGPLQGKVTGLLIAWSDGNQQALEELMPMVYDQLRRLAASFMQHERPDHTLETAALVNEAYLRLVDQKQVRWRDRAHFFAIAGRMMRRILVDHARRHGSAKRGGDVEKKPLDILGDVPVERAPDLLALDEALDRLAQAHPEGARLVELRYFGGLTREEAAEVTGISTATVIRRLRVARAWLHRYLVVGERVDL